MKVPAGYNEAIELCQDIYELVRKLESFHSPESIEEFQELKKGLEYVEIFILNTKE